ncbi:transglycosylase SLT domain-containing protein, partial [Streptomyces sp. NPDC002067]
MSRFALLRNVRVTRTQKVATAVLAAAGATTALAVTAAPSQAAPATSAHAPAAVKPVSANGLPKTAATENAGATSATVSAAGHLKVTAVEKQGHAAKQTANRSAERQAPKLYANNLDGWIRQSLDIMKNKGIPGSYEGLHRNIMRESSGNPNAVNDWDINAINGIPSKGLLQVIQPTFDTYHVKGTAHKLTDP